MSLSVRPAERADLAQAATVFGAAFEETSQWRWMIPDDDTRTAVLPAFFGASLRHALKAGRLDLAIDDTTGSLVGVAAWMPPGKWKVPSWLGVLAVPAVLPHLRSGGLAEFSKRGKALDGAAAEAHPSQPHWYLAGVAVSPSAQGRGVGSRLLREGLSRLGGLPAYLECEESLEKYYEGFGFKVIHRIDPGDGVPIQIGMMT